MVARRKIIAEGNLPLFGTPSAWKAPNISDLPDWSRAKCVALDTEYRDDHLAKLGCGARRGAKIAGISFMLEGGRPFYVPVRHCDGNVENPDAALRYFQDNVAKFEGRLLGANIPGDLDILDVTEGIRFNYKKVHVCDVQLLDAIIDERHFSYSLENIGKRRGIMGKDKELLKKSAQDYGYDVSKRGWEKCIPLLPSRLVGPYAENDASALFPIFQSQWKEIEANDLVKCTNVETRLTPLLLKIRQRGIRVDFDQLDRVEQQTIVDENELLKQIKHLTGYDIGFNNCNAAAAVAPALLDIGIVLPKTAEGQWSITTDILAEIEHPVAKLIRKLRQTNKIRRTFVASVRRYQTNGRIHGTMAQAVGVSKNSERSGAAYGRLSHKDPNTSQWPSKGPYASAWGKVFLPEEGKILCSSDFSSQEPRWVAHTSSLLGLPGADDLVREYQTNPRIDPHSALAQLIYGPGFTKEERGISKIGFLATIYSQGGSKLCKKQLHLPTRWKVSWGSYRERQEVFFKTREEAVKFRLTINHKCGINEVAGEEGQRILDRIHAGAPFLKMLAKKATEKAEATGVLRILTGRLLHFPMNSKGEWDDTHKALNKIVQGSSGMQCKLAMIALDDECPEYEMHTQKHDEVIGSIEDIRVAKRVGEIMSTVVPGMRVPFRCEAECGPNLGSLKVVCNEKGCTNFALKDDKGSKFGCAEHEH